MKILKDNEQFFIEEKGNCKYIEDKDYKGYTIISNYVIFDYQLSGNAKSIYLLIKNFLERNIKITDAKLMHTLKIKKTQFYIYKKELLDKGYLDRIRTNRNEYLYMLMETPKTKPTSDLENIDLIGNLEQLDTLINNYKKRAKMSNTDKEIFERKYEELKRIMNCNPYK